MKILVYDYLFVEGHIHPNTHYINLLAKEHFVTVVSVDNAFANLNENVKIVTIKSRFSRNDIRKSRVKQVLFCRQVNKQVKITEFDAVLFLSYDTDSFVIARYLLPKKTPVILQSHNNIDKLGQKRIHRLLFRDYCNKVYHIVYEGYMKDALVNLYGVERRRVYVLPRARFAYDICSTEKKYSAIGLSGSNNDIYTLNVIEELKNHFSVFSELKIILKAHKKLKPIVDSVEIVTHRISDQEYKEYFNSTRTILVPLSSYFKYRMSGVLFEALSSRKIVIGSDALIVKKFAEKYPHICFSAKSPLEMLKLIKAVNSKETAVEKLEFDKFMNDYTDEKTMTVFNTIFNNIT